MPDLRTHPPVLAPPLHLRVADVMTLSVPEFVALVLAAYVAGLFTVTAVFARLTRTRITPEAEEMRTRFRDTPYPVRDEAEENALADFYIGAGRAVAYDAARRDGGTR